MIGELSAELLTTHYVASIETAISIFYNWLKTAYLLHYYY